MRVGDLQAAKGCPVEHVSRRIRFTHNCEPDIAYELHAVDRAKRPGQDDRGAVDAVADLDFAAGVDLDRAGSHPPSVAPDEPWLYERSTGYRERGDRFRVHSVARSVDGPTASAACDARYGPPGCWTG